MSPDLKSKKKAIVQQVECKVLDRTDSTKCYSRREEAERESHLCPADMLSSGKIRSNVGW